MTEDTEQVPLDPVASARRSHRPPREKVWGAILNKPPGYISTRKEANHRQRPSVYECLPEGWDTPERPLGHFGRLDLESSGLLLFSDDGLLQQGLLNPAFRHTLSKEYDLKPVEKVYHIKTPQPVSAETLEALSLPLVMGGKQSRRIIETLPARVEILDKSKESTWLCFTITEGRNRQIRRLCARSGLDVEVLRRIQLGPLRLNDLEEGQARPLTQSEIQQCYDWSLPGVPVPTVMAF